MTAVYIPTATVSVSGLVAAPQTAILENEAVIVPGSLDGHSPASNKNTGQEISVADRIRPLEGKIEKLEKMIAVQMAK